MTGSVLRRALALGLLALLGGCDSAPPLIPWDGSTRRDAGVREDSGPLPRVDSGTDAGPPPSALVRFVHAAPGAPIVDFRAGGRRVVQDVYYRSATPYRRVAAGSGVLAAFDMDAPESEIARVERAFEDGARYLAILHAPAGAPEIVVVEDTEPSAEGTSVRVVNATEDAATLDVDLDGEGRVPEVEGIERGAISAWMEVGRVRPVVSLSSGSVEPFTLTEEVVPWVQDRALLVIVGRPNAARPSAPEGLSILLVLGATVDASPFFVLRPDPRLAILQASPLLGASSVEVHPNSGADAIAVAEGMQFGDFVETTAPPGRSFVVFQPPDVFFGPQVIVDLLAGHRYLMVTRGDPDQWGPARFDGEVIREGLEGDRFVVVHASPDAPGPARFYTEDGSSFAPIAGLAPLSFGERGPVRGVALDPSARVGIAREDRTTPNVWFDAPQDVGARGYLVVAGSYFAEADARDALRALWVWAPVDGAWSSAAVVRDASSGPLPDEAPPEE